SVIQEAGIAYSTSPNVDTSKNKTPNYTVSGPFSVKLKNLSLLKTYYYKAYAINEKGITYGEEKSFFVPVNGYATSSQVAASSLVGYWAFNDSYIDSVSNTVGTPNHASAVSFVQGKIGKAVQVASPGYINTNVASTIADLKSFTMVFWVQQPASLASGPTTYMPFSLNKAGYSWEQTKFFMLFNNPDNATNSYGKVGLMDQWFDKGQVWPKMLDGEWHQMAISFDGGTGALRVYVDGTLLSQSSDAAFAAQNNFGGADSFTLGGPDDNANTTNGWMNSLSGNLDEFRVFDKALTTEEIQALYALQSNGF
ncbi:MAG: LamG-like jellyroll fold domain-containing protein, partial [Flavisolibacter sp.]